MKYGSVSVYLGLCSAKILAKLAIHLLFSRYFLLIQTTLKISLMTLRKIIETFIKISTVIFESISYEDIDIAFRQ